jgi:hypothetical protein
MYRLHATADEPKPMAPPGEWSKQLPIGQELAARKQTLFKVILAGIASISA